jgi:hypothetical protein
MNPIKMTPSLILVAVAAIIFAIAAYEADPRELKNVSFDLCLGLCLYDFHTRGSVYRQVIDAD